MTVIVRQRISKGYYAQSYSGIMEDKVIIYLINMQNM